MNIRFPALLETYDGKIIEYGHAELASDPNSVNFIGGFIPLYRIGEKITVVRLLGNKRLDVLKGKVFLSSRNLLQVTGIDDAAMARIRGIFYSNTGFQARPYIIKDRKKFFIRLPRIMYETEATVYYISEKEIKFLSMDPIPRGMQFILDLEEPFYAKGILITVRAVIDFGNVMNAYLCDITHVPEEYVKSLSNYIKKVMEAEAGDGHG